MRILFLHPNFPGQFRNPATTLAAAGHEVVNLCQTHYGRVLPAVQRVTLKGPLGHDDLERTSRGGLARSLHLAEQYRKGMQQLQREGFTPDVVVSHSGWGCGLHASTVWPNARHIAYMEWWFKPDSPLANFHPRTEWNLSQGLKQSKAPLRNLAQSYELSCADEIISPTSWQKSQLPWSLAHRCKVIPDGVDIRKYTPASTRPKHKLLTYGTRGMEPLRGFTDFILELKNWLPCNPGWAVQIAGDDRVCYGSHIKHTSLAKYKSYGQWANHELHPWVKSGVVSFVGPLKPKSYQRWLQESRVHIYLTQPFVLSWSLLEAMASGCSLICSDVPPVQEFLDDSCSILIDHRRPGWLGDSIDQLENDPGLSLRHSRYARSRAEAYDQSRSSQQWLTLVAG